MSRAPSFDALDLRAGPRAAAHIRARGLQPSDIGCVPAAAGGPKGLALIALDQWLFGDWLRGAQHLELIGASIGAWRLAAAAMDDPVAALQRLADGYLEQCYPRNPTPSYVSDECRKLARAVLDGAPILTPRSGIGLSLLATRARGVLQENSSQRAFARAALANLWSRRRLAAHMERVIFRAGDAHFPAAPFDGFGLTAVKLTARNSEDALLASGSIPLVCEPVRNPEGAPRGNYWDGGLIDYHLLLPYAQLDRLVLYPHFVPYLTPGWLDKGLPWRRRPRAHPWLDNVLLIAPSRSLLARMPGRKLPDRNDFIRYRDDEDRVRDWRRAMAESQRLAEQAMRWLQAPDPSLLKSL